MISSSENALKRLLIIAATGCALAQGVSSAVGQSSEVQKQGPSIGTVHIDANPHHVLNSFDPDRALGSSLDVLSRVGIDKVHSPHIVQESLSAGWGPITYRNNTELRMGAWHWTENGTWSAAHESGYFTGSTELKEPTRYILAYALPHRGFSASGDRPVQGPNNSHWKSHPYLTSKFTGESDSLHPQWVVLDLATPQPINAIRIAWAEPYAQQYVLQYWTGENPIKFPTKGTWVAFPAGVVTNGKGGSATLRLTSAPMVGQFIRIWMTESSNTCDSHGSADPRNCVGYAIRELYIGTADQNGFYDSARHTPDQDQTTTFCSSVDP